MHQNTNRKLYFETFQENNRLTIYLIFLLSSNKAADVC